MGLFDKIFGIFMKKKPHSSFHDAYDELNQLAKTLTENLIVLRKLQKQLVRQLKIRKDPFPGRVGLSKTLVIEEIEERKEESLIHKLKRLEKETENRFFSASTSPGRGSVSVQEKEELDRIIRLLRKMDALLITEEKIKKEKTTRGKLTVVYDSLKGITDLLEKFHHVEMHGLEKKTLDHRISPLLKKIYYRPTIHKVKNPLSGEVDNILEFKVSKKQVKQLQKESVKINSCHDPRFKVIWRQWWRDEQETEVDQNTGYDKPHINVLVKLDGNKMKNIHLLLAA